MRLAALLAASFALKLAYVFFLTQYASYLFSDFLGYWIRAQHRLAGGELDYGQWAFWPPLAHILLAWYLKLVVALGLGARQLEAALVLNVVASTASVALVYGIVLEVLRSRAWALGVAALYALTFPLVYFNAFVMSEHGATLLLLAALYLVLRFRERPSLLLAAGAALGVATAMRPGLGVLGLPFALYLALAGGGQPRLRLARAAIFSCGVFIVLAAAVAEVNRISLGRVSGLSANGPLAFYFAQCRTATVHINYQGRRSWFTAPSNVLRPENGEVYFDLADYDQRFLSELGWRCLREEPDRGRAFLQRGSDLFFGPLLPSVPAAAGFNQLLPPFRWFFLACTLLLPLAFAVRPSHGVATPALGLVGGMLGISAAMFTVFPTEHRYLYPLVPLIYIVAATVLFAAGREPRRLGAAAAWLAAALALIATAALAVHALRAWREPPPIHTEIRSAGPPLAGAPDLDMRYQSASRRLYSPEGERLWPRVVGSEETHRAVHTTCMEVRAGGQYEFQVVAAGGFTLLFDGQRLLSVRRADLGGVYRWRVSVAPGKHRYELLMDQPISATATWRRLSSRFNDFAPAIGMRYIGEPGEDAIFLPPDRC